MASRLPTAAALLAALAAVYFLVPRTPQSIPSTQRASLEASPPEQAVRPDTDAPIASEAQPTAAPFEENDSTSERVAAIERAISDAIGTADRDRYLDELIAAGRPDAETAVQRFFDELADCRIEAVRRDYESAGVDFGEYLRSAERRWLQGPATDRRANVNGIAIFAWECASGAGRRAGIQLEPPPGLLESSASIAGPPGSQRAARAVPSILPARGGPASIVSPAWADEMEARILRHIALYPGVALTSYQVQCETEGCVVLMRAEQRIDMFRFEFDRFAEANGFDGAHIGPIYDHTRAVHFVR